MTKEIKENKPLQPKAIFITTTDTLSSSEEFINRRKVFYLMRECDRMLSALKNLHLSL